MAETNFSVTMCIKKARSVCTVDLSSPNIFGSHILLFEMLKVLTFLFFLVAFFMGGFEGAKRLQMWRSHEIERLRLEDPFKPTSYPIENHSFVIVIVGRNNGAWFEKTIGSVFVQNYPNYRIVYIDEASDDGSYELARDTLTSQPQVEFLHNEVPVGFLPSLSAAIQNCVDSEIVVVLHGEDRLAHEWVLQRLNQYYANPDLWLTYGQYVTEPRYRFGVCRPLKLGEEPRSAPFVASHLKTFYAKLFKEIQNEDLEEHVFGAVEMAIMVPMLEMAQGHVGYIPDVLCVAHERDSSSRTEQYIRALPPYIALKKLFSEDL